MITQELESQAKQLLQEGVRRFNQAQFQVALEKFQQALAIYEAIGERTNIAVSLNNIGEAYRRLGQHWQLLRADAFAQVSLILTTGHPLF